MDENWEYHYGGIDEVLPGYESSHVYEAVKILLDYGLDPNAVYPKECPGDGEEFNIMWELRYVNNGYQAADTLALLLELVPLRCPSVRQKLTTHHLSRFQPWYSAPYRRFAHVDGFTNLWLNVT